MPYRVWDIHAHPLIWSNEADVLAKVVHDFPVGMETPYGTVFAHDLVRYPANVHMVCPCPVKGIQGEPYRVLIYVNSTPVCAKT